MTTSSKLLDLRGVTDDERNARLNEAVAVIAGEPHVRRVTDYSRLHVEVGEYPDTLRVTYATSCDAVMPLLEKYAWRATAYAEGISVRFSTQVGVNGIAFYADTLAPTLALAFCIALLRANGIKVLV